MVAGVDTLAAGVVVPAACAAGVVAVEIHPQGLLYTLEDGENKPLLLVGIQGAEGTFLLAAENVSALAFDIKDDADILRDQVLDLFIESFWHDIVVGVSNEVVAVLAFEVRLGDLDLIAGDKHVHLAGYTDAAEAAETLIAQLGLLPYPITAGASVALLHGGDPFLTEITVRAAKAAEVLSLPVGEVFVDLHAVHEATIDGTADNGHFKSRMAGAVLVDLLPADLRGVVAAEQALNQLCQVGLCHGHPPSSLPALSSSSYRKQIWPECRAVTFLWELK